MSDGLSVVAIGILALTSTAALLSVGIAAYSRRRTDTPGGTQFTWFAIAIAAWNGLAFGTYLAPDRVIALFAHGGSSIAALVASFLWLEFVLHYTGYGGLLTRQRRAILWLFPAGFGLNELSQFSQPAFRATADVRRYEGLWFVVEDFADPAPFFWAVVPVVLIAVAFGLLARFVLRTRGGYRKQAMGIFTGTFLIYLVVLAFLTTGAGPVEGFDPTPMVNAVMALLVAVALYRWDFLEMVPVAAERLFAEMSDPVIVLTEDGTVADANGAADAIADGGLEGAALSSSLPVLVKAIETDADTVSLTDGDGERTYDVSVTPLYDPYDRQQGRLVVLRDVTVQVQRERELQRQNERLDRFAGVVSHDLRNPLNVAEGFARQTQETGDLSHLDRSLSAMADMEQLIDDLLKLAREGQTVHETEWVEFAEVVVDAWPYYGAEPTVTVESSGEIEADPDRLVELVGNCFRNAREHVGESVTVWVGITDEGFYVEDDGPGIPDDQRETVFDSGFTTSDDGTGLGLSIVDDIARAHGWTVDVETGRTGGARFVVSGVHSRNRSTTDQPLGD